MKKPTLLKGNDLWACLFLLYATAVFLYPVVFTREGSFFIKQDNLHQAYPFYNKLAIALHKGYLPVWDANTYGGKNFAGELQAGIFYPVNVLWCLLFGSIRGIDTWYLDLLMALHYLICVLGMYRLARIFRLSPAGGIAAALVFAFSGAVGARAAGQTCIFCGLVWIPWSVSFVASYYFVRRRKGYLILAGLFAGMEILAGHIQPFLHTILIEGIIIFFYEYKARKDWKGLFLNTLKAILPILIFAIIIALPQLYYASQYMAQAYRAVSGGVFINPGEKVPSYIYGHLFIIKPENLFNFFARDLAQPDDDNTLYMGILPLLLVGIILTMTKAYRGFENLRRLLCIILLVGFLSVLGYITAFHLVLYEIPFLNQIRQLGRYIVLISFSVSLLAGLCITQLKDWRGVFFERYKKQKTLMLVVIALNALYLALMQEKNVALAISVPLFLVAAFFLSLPFLKPLYMTGGAVAIIFIDLLLNPVSYQRAQTAYYPDLFYGKNRIIDTLEKTYGHYRVDFSMVNYGLVRRNLGAKYSIQTKWGYCATVNTSYGRFTDMNEANDPEIDDLLNVRYILTDRSMDTNFIFRDSLHTLKLYERKTWYPRCYWQRQLGQRGIAIESENATTIQQLAYSDNYQRWNVHCGVRDTLIFSENYYPGWSCYDNDRNVEMFPARIKEYPPLFRAIVVSPGEHVVEFRYNKVFYWF